VNQRRISQATLLPAQLRRLAELFPEGGAVGIFQEGSVIEADNGKTRVRLDASGHPLDDPNQEKLPLC
jgi:hypothetical protein